MASSPTGKLVLNFSNIFLEGIWVHFASENENLVTRLAGSLILIELVVVYARWERDNTGGQEENPVALAALRGTGHWFPQSEEC